MCVHVVMHHTHSHESSLSWHLKYSTFVCRVINTMGEKWAIKKSLLNLLVLHLFWYLRCSFLSEPFRVRRALHTKLNYIQWREYKTWNIHVCVNVYIYIHHSGNTWYLHFNSIQRTHTLPNKKNEISQLFQY